MLLIIYPSTLNPKPRLDGWGWGFQVKVRFDSGGFELHVLYRYLLKLASRVPILLVALFQYMHSVSITIRSLLNVQRHYIRQDR